MNLQRIYRLGLLGLIIALVAVLYLLSQATENSAQFGQYFSYLLTFVVAGLLILFLIVGFEAYRLWRAHRRKEPGVVIRSKLMLVFALLAMLPAALVYVVSDQFLQRGLDSWVNVEVETALENALSLSQTSINNQQRGITRQLDSVVTQLNFNQPDGLQAQLSRGFGQTNALYLDLFEASGYLLATVSNDTNLRVPNFPSSNLGLFGGVSPTQFTLERQDAYGLVFRAVRYIPGPEPAVLQGIFPVNTEQARLADQVSSAYDRYKELDYLKAPLKRTFSLVLLFVVLFSFLVGLLFALRSSSRFTRPIVTLARGTKSVAEGDYDRKLVVESQDEFGALVSSFNSMTTRLAESQRKIADNQRIIQQQNDFLATVMKRLSSGVISIGSDGVVIDVNDAVERILGFDLKAYVDTKISTLIASNPSASAFKYHHTDDQADKTTNSQADAAADQSTSEAAIPDYVLVFLEELLQAIQLEQDWAREIRLSNGHQRLVLMVRGSQVTMPYNDEYATGHVVVFDDISGLVVAQRSAAWGEVAQRLAHEVKNPLTPIQLAAERIQRKLSGELPEAQELLLNKSVEVIARQVSSLKDIVAEFSDFAKTSVMDPQLNSLQTLVEDVHHLYYMGNSGVDMVLEVVNDIPEIYMDSRRIRQVLNNVYKNAIEAMEQRSTKALHVTLSAGEYSGEQWIRIQIEDSGPGFNSQSGVDYFEPYVTQKAKGTGLGLAVVKKIIEEHQGFIDIGSSEALGGAKIIIHLPKNSQSSPAQLTLR